LFQETFPEEVATIERMIAAGMGTDIIANSFTQNKQYKRFFDFNEYDRDFVFYSAWQQTVLER